MPDTKHDPLTPIAPPSSPTMRSGVRIRSRRAPSGAAAVLGVALASVPLTHAAHAAPPQTLDPTNPDLGPNVVVFDPSMPTSEIQRTADAIHARQVDNEMGSDRYGLYFLPGTYGTDEEPLQIKVGYYTDVAGLGATPGEVHINGAIEVYNRCFDDPSNPEFVGCFALNNFWRALSNLTIDINTLGQGGCEASANIWAVSQAVSLRRVDVRGGTLSLMDYCSAPSFASGGYIADSRAGVIVNGSQQQWFTRNSEVGEWSNAVWNQVFAGVVGAPDDLDYPDPPYTTLETTPVSREKPYLFVDADGAYAVRVPSARTDSRGISWSDGMTPGRTVPLAEFFVARPGDSVRRINNALARGKHLLLTPGLYEVGRSIAVKRPDTVILGLGLATLKAVDGATPLTIGDRPGVIVAGVTIDAGPVESPVLLQVGKPNGNRGAANRDPANPTTLVDVYFRVGGPYIGKTDIALEVNGDGVLIDHTWVWRADHGVEGFTGPSFGDDQRWASVIGRNGVVVNGDDVTATGLFVEHFQEYNTVWNGERGRVVLYQNELPYDPPTQEAWMTPDGTLGYAGYKVADDVQTHNLWGGGVYVYNRNDPDIVTENGYEVPYSAPGVELFHVMTKNLSGPGTINAVVNGTGAAVDGIPDPGDADDFEDPSYVISYP